MNVSRLARSIGLVGLAVAPWLTLVPQADAADAKAKCRVGANPARVQIAVGANGLAAGTAQFQVTAGGNASSVLTNAVDALGDAAAEWDSAIAVGDVAEGTRGLAGSAPWSRACSSTSPGRTPAATIKPMESFAPTSAT